MSDHPELGSAMIGRLTPDEITSNIFCSMVLDLNRDGRLGYVRPSDEWMDGLEPLPLVLQQAAHVLVGAGFLSEFEEYM